MSKLTNTWWTLFCCDRNSQHQLLKWLWWHLTPAQQLSLCSNFTGISCLKPRKSELPEATVATLAWPVFPLKIKMKCTFALYAAQVFALPGPSSDTSRREDLTQVVQKYWSFCHIASCIMPTRSQLTCPWLRTVNCCGSCMLLERNTWHSRNS